ncbi:Subtilisin-like protease [Mycena kentingensis (nom. inval.)]|nr:Subtilisin-like protease [Mycena kentingensis (nom. inval.)]
MKAVFSLALLAVASSAFAAKTSLSDVKRVTSVGALLNNKFIVEVASASDIPSKRDGLGPHRQLYRNLEDRAIRFHVQKEYDAPGIFVGAALTLSNAADVAAIQQTEGVLAIRPVRTFPRPQPVVHRPGVKPGDEGIPDSQSTHVMTVAGGFDLVGDDYTGDNEPVPDDDPMDCNGHGTHVAGIVGANPGNEFNVSGVAYDATLLAFRIFGCDGGVNDDVIVDALLRGVAAGADILSMSLGGSDGWTEGTGSVVSSRIAATGRIVTIAAGNEGDSGSWFTSGPGNGIDAISVASVQNTLIPLQSLTVTGVTHDPIIYYATFPLPVEDTRPLFATSADPTVVDDACNPLPDDTPDLSGFVVLVRRGTCLFVDKIANIAAKGATVALIYDNGSGFAGITVGDFNAVLIQAEDGVFLAEQLAAGAEISVTFPQTGASVNFADPEGGLVSGFSTYGPTNDMFFKPAIAAPGGNILSTFPVNQGSWALESGTSMATPFLAGSSALLLSAKGKSPAVGRTARTLFQSTAFPIPSSKTDGDPLQPVAQQGAGLIQVFDAIFATTILSKGELLLNDTAHFAGTQRFTVANTGKKAKTYTLTHVPAGTTSTVDPDLRLVIPGPVPIIEDFATVKFNAKTFTVPPGRSHEVVATFTPPLGSDPITLPVYGGYINVVSGTESVRVSYLGVASSLKDQPVLDNTDFVFGVTLPVVLDATGNVQEQATNYTFIGDDAPLVIWRQLFGTPALRLDLVDAATTFKPTLSSRDAPVFSFGHKPAKGTFAQVPTVGLLLEVDWLTRNDLGENDVLDNEVLLTNTFANGTTIPNGAYKILLRSLKVTGDPKNEADWESWLSPVIGVVA